jgi:DNA polymerase-3 subunit delta'
MEGGAMTEPPAPAANPYLVGHAVAERAWLTAWRSGRLPHAWLLAGPRGVGKATLAYRLARAYLAGRGAEAAWNDPTAPVFRMVASRGHPDLVVLEPATGKGKNGLWKVGDVRDALEGLYRTSTTGRRVCLIDEADTVLNEEGENALLKVLEEPPPGLVFLLVAQRSGGLLRTIQSRCAALRLAPLPEALVEEGLRRLVPDRDPADLPRLAELGEGSIGRALELGALDWTGAYAALLDAFATARDEGGRLRAVLTLMRQAEGV